MTKFDSTTEQEQTTDENEALQSSATREEASDDTDVKETQVNEQASEADQPAPSLKKVSLKFDDDGDYELELPEKIADRVKNERLMYSEYMKKTKELSEDKNSFKSQKTEFDTSLGELRKQLEYERDQLNSDEMKELKEYDSEAYYKRFNAFQDRSSKYNEYLAQSNKEAEKAHQADMDKEYQNYSVLIPEWLDDKTKNEELSNIGNFLKEKGFTDADFKQIYPAKFVQLARNAMLYENAKKSGQSKRKETPPTVSKAKSTNQPPVKMSLEEKFLASMKK